ncbi:MAG: Asp-tRNA(Asn)/Glu-tRNA(Gln) amidotransferase subunit GatC [Peptococcaceae bacterium]|nr:Asp-tRNA(Asn)/Glu-tRNA(Gln) amidotransferase subunit GatC [Peptococcaceae bacterium]
MLTKEAVERVAHLSRLEFTEEELEKQYEQLGSIIEMMDSLNEIDTSNVTPLNHVMDIHNVFREDVVHESMGAEKVLANAPEEHENMFQVPKIV